MWELYGRKKPSTWRIAVWLQQRTAGRVSTPHSRGEKDRNQNRRAKKGESESREEPQVLLHSPKSSRFRGTGRHGGAACPGADGLRHGGHPQVMPGSH